LAERGSQFDDLQGANAPTDDNRSSFHARLLDSIFDGVYFVDTERKITYWNRGSENLTGYTAAEAVGRHCFENFLMHVDQTGCSLCTNGCPLASTIRDGQRREAEIFLRHKLGHRVPVSVRVAPMTDASGRIIGAVEVFSDATAKEQAERRVHELETMAFRDSLTSVPNRRYTELKVKQALEESQQFGRSFGLLMLDIDHFKGINDRYGHDVGDATLKAVSETLTKTLRGEDDLVSRWGGEEFLVLLSDVNATSLQIVAERCRALVEKTGALSAESRVPVTTSVGATLIVNGDSTETAIKRADQLMYLSKANGRNRTTVG
jgi:diguanylate cyclase (GGDEF)-like protein/PAS domain S-box-containing protein